ncbi:MAG: hypothetical protein AB1791_22110 [Chloroflexota bacterium]
MKRWQRFIQWQAVAGDPVRVGDIVITLQAQALAIRLPFAGLVWNRPLAVLVERDGRQERIPIVNVTRLAQIALLALAVVFLMAGRLARR